MGVNNDNNNLYLKAHTSTYSILPHVREPGFRIWNQESRAKLVEGRLALNPGFFFLCSKAFSGIILSVIFRASNHQLGDKKN